MSNSMRVRFAKLGTVILGFLAAGAVLGSPWSGILPLSSGLFLWFRWILPLLSSGNVMAASNTAMIQSIWGALVALIFALPFLFSIRMERQVASILRRSIGVLLIGFALLPLLEVGRVSEQTAAWEGALVIGLTCLIGILLIGLGIVQWNEAHSGERSLESLYSWTCILTGACLATFVLTPIGIGLLAPTYAIGAVSAWKSKGQDS